MPKNLKKTLPKKIYDPKLVDLKRYNLTSIDGKDINLKDFVDRLNKDQIKEDDETITY